MSKRTVNYRKIYQKHYGCTLEEMRGMDVHHLDWNKNNNKPENLVLLTPEKHAEIHKDKFVVWARKGSKLAHVALNERLSKYGPTEKEVAHRKRLSDLCKTGIHNTPHSDNTKEKISKSKKIWYENNVHPMSGHTKYKLISPSGEESIISENWKDWCKQNGLNPSNLRSVALGNRTHHKGWKAIIINE